MVKNKADIDRGDNVFIVIVAAGSGLRFGSTTPKQFLPLAGRPVLVRTVEAFTTAIPDAKIILVLSDNGRKIWSGISSEYRLPHVLIAKGGSSRTQSVNNALALLEGCVDNDTVVMVHDGARPLVNGDMIRALLATSRRKDIEAVVPVMPLTEALANDCGDTVTPAPREKFRTVQTPQVFKAVRLIEAYEKADGEIMPDDAAVIHRFTDAKIFVVPGHPQNIKITNPNDIAVAELLLANPLPY